LTEHREFQHDLAAWTASRLEGEARLRLEAHLAECDECRELASLMREFGRAMQEGGEALFEAHPSPAALLEHARGGADEAMLRHLEICAACRLEVDGWTRTAIPGKNTIKRMVWPLAAGVLLGVGLATFARMAMESRPAGVPGVPNPASGPGAAVAGPMLFLPPLQRGVTERVVHAAGGDVGFEVVACPARIPDDASPDQGFEYAVKKTDGNAVWSEVLSARTIREQLASQVGSVILLIPAASLPPGRYELTLGRVGPHEEPIYRIDLEMITAQ